MHLKPFFLSDSFQASGIAKKNVLSAESKLSQTERVSAHKKDAQKQLAFTNHTLVFDTFFLVTNSTTQTNPNSFQFAKHPDKVGMLRS